MGGRDFLGSLTRARTQSERADGEIRNVQVVHNPCQGAAFCHRNPTRALCSPPPQSEFPCHSHLCSIYLLLVTAQLLLMTPAAFSKGSRQSSVQKEAVKDALKDEIQPGLR